MKGHIFFGAACVMAAAPAMAGPYINTELKSSWTGSDYSKSTWHNDLGFESKLSKSTKFYIQGGPAAVLPDGKDHTVELAGKTGLKVKLADGLSGYGEVAAMTQDEMNFDEDLKFSTKVGLKYAF